MSGSPPELYERSSWGLSRLTLFTLSIYNSAHIDPIPPVPNDASFGNRSLNSSHGCAMSSLGGYTYHVCPVCRSDEFHLFCLNGSRPLKRCTDCGFVYAEEIPSLQKVQQEYLQHFDTVKKTGLQIRRRVTYRLQTKLIKLLFLRRRMIRTLHLGCGSGLFLKQLDREIKFEAMGLERMPQFVEEARKQSLDVYQSSLEEMSLRDQIFDFIHAADLPGFYHNPERTCLDMHRVLAPAGILFLSLPRMEKLPGIMRGELWGHEICEQLWHFSAKNASVFLQRLGFRVHFVKVSRNGASVFLIAGKQPNLEWDKIPHWVGIEEIDTNKRERIRQAA
ncbi:MAG: methyltransferase domain-containing protein [Planctomycetaceae bacterium]|nr:class I SAM-dependent methyltransferase [Planctomycetaceae bacterium]MDC0273414.1 class I SAM-dependent methyltransferase [Planctomycetaceae bacterium]MDG2389009.1 methyltransferase domain-containing protein [Planctomycetaceae bacterium]